MNIFLVKLFFPYEILQEIRIEVNTEITRKTSPRCFKEVTRKLRASKTYKEVSHSVDRYVDAIKCYI